MNTLTIGVDMDGVIVNLIKGWIEMYREVTGEDVHPNVIQSSDAAKEVGQPDVMYEIMRSDGFFRNLPPYLDAIDAFKALLDSHHNVHIVTTPHAASPYSERDKKLWMQDWFPEFPARDITFTHYKYLYRCDLLLDDMVKNLRPSQANGIRAVCMDQPWNQEWAGDRVYSWSEFLDMVGV